jgi:hypothetical protein
MAVSLLNTWEGQPNGTVPSTSNTASGGQAIASAPAIASGGAITFSTDRYAFGAQSLKISHPADGASGANRVLFAIPGSPVAGRAEMCAAVYIPASGDAIEDIMSFRSATGNCGTLVLALDGKMQLFSSAGTAIAASKSTNAVSAPGWYWVCHTRTKGTTSANGTLGYALYDLDGTLVHSYDTGATVDARTDDTTQVSYGRATGRLTAHVYYYDNPMAGSQTSGYTSPPVQNLVVTVYNNQGLFKVTGGSPPFGVTQTGGPTVAATVENDGTATGIGLIRIPQHATDDLIYTVTDDNGTAVTTLTVTPAAVGSTFPKYPDATPPDDVWA